MVLLENFNICNMLENALLLFKHMTNFRGQVKLMKVFAYRSSSRILRVLNTTLEKIGTPMGISEETMLVFPQCSPHLSKRLMIHYRRRSLTA